MATRKSQLFPKLSPAEVVKLQQAVKLAFIPSSTPLVDGQMAGYLEVVTMTFATANVATTKTLKTYLGHTPLAYWTIRNAVGGVVYDAAGDSSSWGPLTIVLRATVAGTYTLFVW